MSLYSIVIPVYNSEKSLELLYDRITNVFDNVIKQPFEMILIDDCSKDDSYKIIKQLTEKDSRIKGIQLSINHGQQKAVLCGFRHTKGDYIITMDDDLQHPPEQIPILIDEISKSDDYDVIIGAYDTKQHNVIRRFGSYLMNLSHDIIYKKPKDLHMTSFRIIRRSVIDNINQISISQPTVGVLLLQTTKRIKNVRVHHDKRAYGKSGYGFRKLVKLFLCNVITNSDLPLLMVMYFGIFSQIASICLGVFFLIRYLIQAISITGWTSTVLLLLFFGGATLFSIGLIGRYLITIMLEAKKYPSYFIRRTDGEIKDA